MRKRIRTAPGRRVLALALCLALLCPLLGSPGFAEDAESGLCEHHPAHTAECGFSAGSPESPCTHVHDESCYTALCLYEGEEGHVCSEESGCLTLACTHSHDESCGYAPEVPAAPCQFNCPVCAGEETPVPTESPVPAETPGPAESPESTETPEPAETPQPTESPEPSEEPALPVMTLSGAELTDAESGEPLWSWVSGEEPEDALWPLQGEQILTLRVDCPAVPESGASRQLRLSLSPLLRLTGWEEAEGLSFTYGPLNEEGTPPASGGELLCTLEPAVAALELKLRLAADGPAREGQNAAPEELFRAELLVNGEAPEEPALLLKGFMDPGVSLMAAAAPYTRDAAGKNFANLVIFAYFQDQPDGESFFRDPANAKKLWELYEGGSGRSFKNYISTVSYGKLQVLNVLPQYDSASGTIHAVCLSGSAAAAQSQNIDSEIIRQALAGVDVDGSILDLNRDGTLDNVTVILKGGEDKDNENSNVSFAAHKSDYPGSLQAFGLQVSPYNMQNTDRVLGGGGSGVLAHEFLHTLGFSDLYNHDQTFPVYTWDIMGSSSARPSWPLAYTRREQGWVELSTVTESCSLSFTAPGQGDGSTQAYILQAPQNDRELFVVELRHRGRLATEDDLDSGVSAAMNYDTSGLIVYRVDTSVRPLSNYYGSTGIYVFRPTGYGDESQNVQHAFLNTQEGRTSIGSEDPDATLKQGALTFQNGANSGIVVKNVRDNGNGTMSCEVVIPSSGNYDTWEDTRFSVPTDSYDKCAVVTASLQGAQYLVTYTNGVFRTYRYSAGAWSELSGAGWTETSRAAPELRMVEHGGKLILGYADYPNAHLKLRELDPGAGKWRELYTGTEVINSLELQSQGSSLYIVYETAEKAGLLELSGGAVTDRGSYLSGSAGQPQQAAVNGTLYVASRRVSGNVIEIYRREPSGAYQKISDGKIAGANYSIAALNGKLVVVTSQSSSLTVWTYDGSQWTQGKTSPIDCFDPKLTVLQGNLYLLSASSTGGGYVYVYQYDPYTGGWLKEGLQVDAYARSITLTTDQNYLYVSYVLDASNKFCVRRKALANALLSLEVTPPTRTEYTQGEPVSTAGMAVTAHYEREDRVLREGEYVLTGFDSGTVGSRTATVSYGGKTAGFRYTVKAAVTPPTPQEPYLLTLTPPAGYGDAHIYIDGAEYPAKKSGGSYSLTLPDTKGRTAVMYKYSGSVPTGMAVWKLSYQGTKVTATELTGLRDLISYHGFSIRIQAPAGIRFKSGISEATRARLLGGGVDGCRLLEYGTLFMTQNNRKTLPFVKGGAKVGGGRAYWSEKGRVTDLIYERVSGRLRFTSVLIDLAPDMYSVELAFRGYVILDRGGEQLIIYGPPVSRSVYQVAQQVMSAREFPAGSAGYRFVESIIKSVERR